MEKRLPLLRGEATLESALASEDDMRLELTYPRHQKDLYSYLDSHRSDIEAVVSYNLGLKGIVSCQLADVDEWICGSFNVCIPVYIHDGAGWPRRLALIRVPLWYKLGESRRQGNIEEKLRCEAATFIWIKQNCPEIPMPRLWGFGFPGGQADKGRRANFFTYLSRFMLSLAKCSFPRIGSMTIDEQGDLVLENRPLTFPLHKLENSGVQLDICQGTTYSNVESYILGLLSCHDSRIRHQANSIRDHSDGEMKLSVLTAMRALLPHFASRNLRNSPFIFTLTDIHLNKIFVDGEWRITSVIGLDWACVRPIEMIHPPTCLTGLRVDQLSDDNAYDLNHDLLKEFFDAFTQEEASFAQRTHLAPFWDRRTRDLIDKKLRDKEEYEEQLREQFERLSG
ncbi:hypothetical protein SLS56_011692 [Neofusicoccum ribis]|uniref:Aminoglycoside phosphotransferase domain-containing protein n=1 Tax=Neofusicoccum ribis TaxID=45134 RepID=A0ABR3SBJ0_9PEZI